jgi:NCS2 family nucleobase:cation symporter-2
MKFREKWQQYSANADVNNIYHYTGAVPLKKAIPFGLQHVLAMFIANITPILIVYGLVPDPTLMAQSIRAAILFAGIGTLIQLFPIGPVGSRLPIVVGVSFTFVGVLVAVLAQFGLGVMLSSMMIGGVVIGILGLFAKYWVKFIKPIVSACVVFAIGLSLLKVGVTQFLGGTKVFESTYDFTQSWPYLLIAVITLIAHLLWKILTKGTTKNLAILVGLGVGVAVSLFLSIWFPIIDFTQIQVQSVTDVINIPQFIHFSDLEFNLGATLVVIIIFFVASTEGIGDMTGVAFGGFGRQATTKEYQGGIACDGFISALGACFGSLPLTTYSQNVAIVGQTKIVNRTVIACGAIFLILVSFFPIITNLILLIPEAVLGGLMIILFSQIVVIGIEMISKVGFSENNILIVTLSLGLGYGITLLDSSFFGGISQYLALFLENPVINMFLIAFVLSFILKEKKEVVTNNLEATTESQPEQLEVNLVQNEQTSNVQINESQNN